MRSLIAFVAFIILSIILGYLSSKLFPNNPFLSYCVGTIAGGFIQSCIIPLSWSKALDYIKGYFLKEKYYDRLLEQHLALIKKGQSLDTDDHEKYFLKLFKPNYIDKEFINNLNDKQAAVFIIGLQFYYRYLKFSEGIGACHLT